MGIHMLETDVFKFDFVNFFILETRLPYLFYTVCIKWIVISVVSDMCICRFVFNLNGFEFCPHFSCDIVYICVCQISFNVFALFCCIK